MPKESINETKSPTDNLTSVSVQSQPPRRRAPPPPYQKHFSSSLYGNALEMDEEQNNYHQRGHSEQNSGLRDYNKVS